MIPKRNLSEEKVSLEIDLEKLFGHKVTDPVVRREIAEDLIGKIEKRTAAGSGVNGVGKEVALKAPYSDVYAASDEFKAFGKSKNKVNMKLTGSMMSSLNMIAEDSRKIEIGIDNEEAAKAFNHITGDTVPRRPFLGLTADDLESVKNKYKKQASPVTVADIFEARNIARLINAVSRRRIVGFEE